MDINGSKSFAEDPNDPTFMRVSFTNWPANVHESEKIRHIEDFMAKNFANIRVHYVDKFNEKSFFVQVGTAKSAKEVVHKSKELKIPGLPDVKVRPALTRIDISRNWNLYEAERVIKADPRFATKKIDMHKGSKDKIRGVYDDNGALLLQQERCEPVGRFVQAAANLKIS